MWEDEGNKGGGKITLKIKKGFINKIWEDLLMGIIGETYEESEIINGIILLIKKDADII